MVSPDLHVKVKTPLGLNPQQHQLTKLTERGGALIDFAILLPVCVVLFTAFFEVGMRSLAKVRHQNAAIQMALNFQETGLVLNVQAGGHVTLRPRISAALLTDPQTGFLPKFNRSFNSIMKNIGSAASFFKHNVALSLYHSMVCSSSQTPCTVNTVNNNAQQIKPGGISPGTAGYEPSATTLNEPIAFNGTQCQHISGALPSQCFYTSDGVSVPANDDDCFGAPGSATRIDAETKFKAYIAAQLNMMTTGALNTNTTFPALGTLLLDSGFISSNFPTMDAYQEQKSWVFWMMCSLPPSIVGNTRPVLDMGTMFLDLEFGA
jgi:hypothetical protein